MAFIGTLISCYCNPDVGNRRGGGRGGPKSREKGEKNNGEHVLLFKITHSWGLFGVLKTWFCMPLIGWCHVRPLTSDLPTLLRSSFCKCCVSHMDFSVASANTSLSTAREHEDVNTFEKVHDEDSVLPSCCSQGTFLQEGCAMAYTTSLFFCFSHSQGGVKAEEPIKCRTIITL